MESKDTRATAGIGRRVTVELAAVVLLVVVAVLGLFHVIDVATTEQRRVAVESASDVVRGLVETQLDSVARLVLDYAYWDDALLHVSATLDRQWAKENIGAQLYSAQDVDLVAVIDSEDRPRIVFRQGKAAETVRGLDRNSLGDLLTEARRAAPLAEQIPRVVVALDGAYFFMAAFQMISQTVPVADAAKWHRDHPDQSVLVFARKLDQRFIDRLTDTFHLRDARLDAGGCPPDAAGCVAVGRPDAPVAHIAFRVQGVEDFIARIRFPVAVALLAIAAACAIAMARLFILARRLAAKNDDLDAEVVRRRRSEEDLRASEERRRLILLTAMDGFLVADAQGRLLEVNGAFCRMSGYGEAELLGMRLSDLDAAGPADIEARGRQIAAEGELRFETRHRRKDGTVIDVEVSAQYRPLDGRIVAFLRDITERRRAEERMLQAQKMGVVGQLAGGTAHDFNNLLQVIQANLDLIDLKTGGGETLSQLVEAAKNAVRRGAKLSQQLLAFSRRQPLHPETVDPNEQIEGTVRLLRRTLGEDVTIDARLADDCRAITIDPYGLENALLNLALNARAAMPRGGTLTIRSANRHVDGGIQTDEGILPAGSYVEISMTDTGEGMPPEVLTRAFEPFFTTKDVGQGSGLGLSMVYGFTLQSKGYVTLESAVGRGTTVRMLFPAATAKPGTARQPSARMPAANGTGAILVVEDDMDVRRSVMTMLERLGYDTRDAGNAAAALAILDGDSGIDLLFTDVVMPGGMNGVDLVREALRRRPDLKILLTSGYPEGARARAAIQDRDFKLLAKPYSNVELGEAIGKALLA